MEENLKYLGSYRILYAQPAPETGERIAVAVLVQDGSRNIVYFDHRFPRLKRFFGELELGGLMFYLDDLKRALLDSHDPESILNTYAPQIVPSDFRKIALPLSEDAIKALLKKILRAPARVSSTLSTGVRPFTKAIAAYVTVQAGVTEHVQTDVAPEVIFGRPVSGLRPIALAIQRGLAWVLIDGVDLNELTPTGAKKRADEVARNFWQFRREAEKSGNVDIKKIGLVLNGNSHLKPETREAHDYSLHRLEADSDRAFDGSSVDAPAEIRREVLGFGN